MALRVQGFRFIQCVQPLPGSRWHASCPGPDRGTRGGRAVAIRAERVEKSRDVVTRPTWERIALSSPPVIPEDHPYAVSFSVID